MLCPTLDRSIRDLNLVGIDPGTEKMGVSVINFDAQTLKINYTTASTFVARKLPMSQWDEKMHSSRYARLGGLRDSLLKFFQAIEPVTVACETPYFNRLHPSAFAPLVETLGCVREAVVLYDRWVRFEAIEPSRAKAAIGAKGSDKKDPVRDIILGMGELNYRGSVALDMLDEHAIDAIAIAYTQLKQYRESWL